MRQAGFALLMAGAVGLAGCTVEVAPAPVTGVCDASGAEFAIGAVATPSLVEQARIGANANTARVIEPGDAVTLDYRTDRLNIELNASGRVTAVSCN